jgi:hypothetical protein
VSAGKSVGHSLDEFKELHDPLHRIAPGTVLRRDLRKDARVFIITAAQNATPVHRPFFDCLLSMAAHRKAELLVIPLRYKNPTSRWTGSQQNAEHWDAPVRPYLWNARYALNRNLTVLGDIKVQPTASSPLTGLDALSHASSGIVGHTKLQLKTVPTPSAKMAKILTTTGACTVPNYTDSRAGRVGDFHHSLSAVVVELDGPRFHLRQVHFDGRSQTVTDLDRLYMPKGHGTALRPLALVMGDTHVDSIDPRVEAATFGPGGIVPTLRPVHLVWHDLLDGYSCNPHHRGNPFSRVAKRRSGRDDVKAEVGRAINYVRDHTPKDAKSIVVGSNHNDFLRRWVIDNDWRTDPVNAPFYLETALAMVNQTTYSKRGTSYPDPFTYWMEQAKLERTRVLRGDESCVIGGVELGMHGDAGPNGAKGSIKNLRRIGVRSFIGHGHAPGIDEGCYQVGTSTVLKLEYTHGPSGWLNTHGLLHADGKRQLIHIIDGKWRA